MSTPIDRATEALLNPGVMLPWDDTLRRRELARAAVSAALTDPDAGRDPVAEALCSHNDSEHHMERTDDFPCSPCVSAADAVRAAILGEA